MSSLIVKQHHSHNLYQGFSLLQVSWKFSPCVARREGALPPPPLCGGCNGSRETLWCAGGGDTDARNHYIPE
jgi:hypothetical protein